MSKTADASTEKEMSGGIKGEPVRAIGPMLPVEI